MIPRDFTFLYPGASVFLIALPFIALLFFYAEKKRKQSLERLASLPILAEISTLRNPKRSLIRMVFFMLFWTFACLALMNPVGNEHFKSQSVKTFSQDIVFFLDASASMAALDTPTKISRFDSAKEIADLIIKKLKGNDMLLATFTTGATLIVPQTHDALFLRIRLKDLEINEGTDVPGSDYLNAFNELKKILFFDRTTSPTVLVLLADGGDTALESLPDAQTKERTAKILEAVNSKNFPNLDIYSIGIGSINGGEIPKTLTEGKTIVVKLNRSLLEALSRSTGGNYYSANEYNAEVLANTIVQEIEKRRNLGTANELVSKREYDEYFQIPLVLSFAFLLLFMLFPSVKQRWLGLFLLVLYQSIDASEDFAARQLFEAGEYKEAASHYQNLLSSMPDAYQPLLYYNLGTILLAEKEPLQAIEMLEGIPWAKDVSSNVKRRSLVNLAAAYNEMQTQSSDSLLKILFLKKALQALYSADKLNCEEEHCLPSSDFIALKNELSTQMNALPDQPLENIDLIALLWNSIAFRSLNENAGYSSTLVESGQLWQKLAQSVDFMPAVDHNLEKFKEFLYVYYEAIPKDLLLNDIGRLFALEQSKPLLLFLLQKAGVFSPELKAAESNLVLSMQEKIPGKADYFFINSLQEFQKVGMKPISHLAKKELLNLIDNAKIAVRKELLFLSSSDEIAIVKPAIIGDVQNVLAHSKRLPKAIYEWQIKRFKQGICQCKPWNEVFPLLKKANELWQGGSQEEITYLQISKQKDAIRYWQQALKKIETIPEGPSEDSQNVSEALNELQKMQLLDKQPPKMQKKPQGGKFW